MAASPAAIYRAWTEEFGSWFASPGVIRMRAEEDEPFFFEAEHEGRRHAHHGRFLTREQDRLIELTWITGSPGTAGAETVVTVQLDPADAGTHLRLTHAGFYDEAGVKQHDVWPTLLAGLDEASLAPRSPAAGSACGDGGRHRAGQLVRKTPGASP